ncbi:MAG: hypothetical protein WKF66_14175 [Pedobacter sp.]
MKKLLLTASAVLFCLYGNSQTKGTSTLSLGISANTNEVRNNSLTTDQISKTTNSVFKLGYGLFVEDNNKIGVELLYNRTKSDYFGSSDYREDEGFGAALSYQRYFPLVKTFYAYAGASGQYLNSKGETRSPNAFDRNSTTNNYSLLASGGLTWFISNRWALETNLISTGLFYSETKYDEIGDNQSYSTNNTNFNLSTDGIINNLGFKVYLMF